MTSNPTSEGLVERDNIGSALVAGLDAHAANVYRHAPLGLSNEEARAWYRGYDTRTDVRPDPVPLAKTPLGIALTTSKALVTSLRNQLEGANEALRPAQGMFNFVPGQQYEFRFRNYRGEDETRHVIFQGSDYGANAYYPEPQWFIRCWDIERGEPRSFLLSNIDVGSLSVPSLRLAASTLYGLEGDQEVRSSNASSAAQGTTALLPPSAEPSGRWRKRPVVVDAWQFVAANLSEMPAWVNCDGLAGENLYIETLEGTMRASEGDWVIRGVRGEIYPCKPDVFAATYEPAAPLSAHLDAERQPEPREAHEKLGEDE